MEVILDIFQHDRRLPAEFIALVSRQPAAMVGGLGALLIMLRVHPVSRQ